MITGYNINLDHIKKKLVSVLTVAFAKKWEGGRFFFLNYIIFNALVLSPKLDLLAQYRYFSNIESKYCHNYTQL